MVLFAPFLRLHHPLASFVWLLRHFLHYETREVEAQLQPFYYARRPLKAIYQLLRLAKEVRRKLPEISAPTLVIASEGDATADHASAIELFERLAGTGKKLQLYGEDVPHTMLGEDNPRRRELIREAIAFLESLEISLQVDVNSR